ncbi:hypothetical protein CVT26_012134 [Gymnopilus dilepis]|uniref:Uncharacterized protein n=1 Tax=Gymnopilus dilepis TaxID=231916 RepID=A0A409YGV0_9AGAR|nr:hypothetical protein CVT26_012134 [Gymnopilus dilepis]
MKDINHQLLDVLHQRRDVPALEKDRLAFRGGQERRSGEEHALNIVDLDGWPTETSQEELGFGFVRRDER